MSNTVIDNKTTDAVKENTEPEELQNKDNLNVSDDVVLPNVENSVLSDTSISNDIAFNQDELKYDDAPEPNCLALTVKKDYNLTVIKNVFTTTGRLTWKIALVTAIINMLNMLF